MDILLVLAWSVPFIVTNVTSFGVPLDLIYYTSVSSQVFITFQIKFSANLNCLISIFPESVKEMFKTIGTKLSSFQKTKQKVSKKTQVEVDH